MLVKIKKVHKKYEELFPLGTVVTFRRSCPNHLVACVKSEINQEWYPANDLCRCFSNRCSFSDIFDKVSEKPQPMTVAENIRQHEKRAERYQSLIDNKADYSYYKSLLDSTNDIIVKLKYLQDA